MSDSPAHPSSTRAWLELTRAPNFLTAWGDPMAGALLASTGNFQSFDRLIPGVIGVLCLYAAGMILNDVADRRVDAAERPGRPIPSGRIRAESAAAWGLTLWAVGMLSALPVAGRPAVVLAAAVLLYTFVLKRTPGGPVLLGLCRAFSVLVGAGAVGAATAKAPLFAALIIGGYVTFVSFAARRECESTVWTPRRIGQLLGLLPLLQAAACAMAFTAGSIRWIFAAVLAVMPLLHARVRREIAAS